MVNNCHRGSLVLLALLATVADRTPAAAADPARRVADLPQLHDRPLTTDWLIDDSPYTAGVYRTEQAEDP